MITRYSHPKMATVWTDAAKFSAWLEVELAVLRAREELGQIPTGTHETIRKITWIDERVVRAIEEREQALGHDMGAFIDVVRAQIILGQTTFTALIALTNEAFQAQLDAALAEGVDSPARFFHDGLTSYDVEETATALLLRRAIRIIRDGIVELQRMLVERAKTHRGDVTIGRTHGQAAQPTTFGVRCLNWLEMVSRLDARLFYSLSEIEFMKLSGAVGMYGTLGPEVEQRVAEIVELSVAPIATQILPLERRAQLINTLAEGAAVVAKIAHDLWLLAQTGIEEIREPFGARQMGSSAMPHKKNPIVLEQLFGLARLFPGYAAALLAGVPTALERDISHSSVERVVLADSFGLLDHMLIRLTRVIQKMSVFPERMKENLAATQGTYASQRVEQYLARHDFSANAAYRIVQVACATAMTERVNLQEVLLRDPTVAAAVGDDPGFNACFDAATWIAGEDARYHRMAIPR